MSKRQKKITLFSKNHITITKTENVNNLSKYVICNKINNSSIKCDYISRKKNEYYVDVIKESPLGFKYIEQEKRYRNQPKDESKYYKELYIVNIYLEKTEYEFVYPILYNHTHIGKENRPWDIVEGDKSISEHFIFALKNEIDKLFEVIKENKLTIHKRGTYYSGNKNLTYQELHDKIYEDVFGDKRGIRFQTDEEKILAHGFDKVTSFRKM